MVQRNIDSGMSMRDEAARAIIADHLGVPLAVVQDETEFLALGADSLDIITLTMRFEEEFDLRVPDDQVDRCRTVRDALSLLSDCSPTRRLVQLTE